MRPTRNLLVIAALALVAVPAAAQYRRAPAELNAFRVRIGEFSPRGNKDYWIDKRNDFIPDENAFDDAILGVDYLRAVGPRITLIASASSWETDVAQEYRNFVDEAGLPILHTTSFEVSSLEAGLLFRIGGRGASVSPYLGGGGGYYDWTLAEDGDFIDFTDLSIFSDRFFQSGDAFGWFWLVGLDVRLGDAWRAFAEWRGLRADDQLAGDFAGLGTLDLSGDSFSVGVGWSF
jgi:hypothetical protein